MIWYDMIRYDLRWYDMRWYDMRWYDMIWYDMIWYIYIYVLRTPMTFIFEGQPPKQGFFQSKQGSFGSIGICTGARLQAETGSPGSWTNQYFGLLIYRFKKDTFSSRWARKIVIHGVITTYKWPAIQPPINWPAIHGFHSFCFTPKYVMRHGWNRENIWLETLF